MRTVHYAPVDADRPKADPRERLLAIHRALNEEIRVLRFRTNNLSLSWPERSRLRGLEERLGYVELALHVFFDHHVGAFSETAPRQGRGMAASCDTGRKS